MHARMACGLILFFVMPFGENRQRVEPTPPDIKLHAQEIRPRQMKPRDGYVPDTKTATRVAEAVLAAVYGDKEARYLGPFHATLDGDVWTVTGSMDCKSTPKEICVGGVSWVQISKATGEILLLAVEG